MMHSLRLLAVLSMLVAGAAHGHPGNDLLDSWNGFRDAHFGQTRAQIGGAWVTRGRYEGDPHLRVYVRRGAKKEFSGVPLTEIVYVFRDGRLARVALETKGVKNALRLRDEFDKLFGEEEGAVGGVLWTGKQVVLTHICVDPQRECKLSCATFTNEALYFAPTPGPTPKRAHNFPTIRPNKSIHTARGGTARV